MPPYLRAEAFMAKGAFGDAVREYQKVLQHRGVDPFAPMVPLAQLGLARAHARSGNIEAARRAYDELFTIWKAAEPDFAPLAAARAEYARLDDHAITPVTTPLRISHYEVLERIGRDGPTEIYRARDLRLERDVALKLLRPEALAQPGRARPLPPRSAHRLARHPSAHLHRPRFRRAGRTSRSSSASCSKGARWTRWSKPRARWRRIA